MHSCRRSIQLAITCAIALSAAAGARAGAPPRFMPVGAQVAAPRGYLEFCARASQECPEFQGAVAQADATLNDQVTQRSRYWRLLFASVKPGSIRSPTESSAPPGRTPFASDAAQSRHMALLTSDVLKTLREVNAAVNTAIIPRSDMEVYGVADYWAEPLKDGIRYGDCEDYVLEKRRQLLALGYPVDDLSIALVRTAWREFHAVLLVNTDQGEMVLDSLSPYILSWRNVSYHWLSRQSPTNPALWVAGPGSA